MTILHILQCFHTVVWAPGMLGIMVFSVDPVVLARGNEKGLKMVLYVKTTPIQDHQSPVLYIRVIWGPLWLIHLNLDCWCILYLKKG